MIEGRTQETRLGGRGDGLGSHPGTLGAGTAEEAAQLFGSTGFGFDPVAGEFSGRGLGAVVDVVAEPTLLGEALGDAADVRRRDVDDVRVLPGLAQGPVEMLYSSDVGAERLVDGGVEGHRRGVDDDVEGVRQRRQVGEVTLADLDTRRESIPHGGLTGPSDPGAEDRFREQPFEALPARPGAPGTHEGGDGDVRPALEQGLEHRLTEESRHAGQENAAGCHVLPIGSRGNGLGCSFGAGGESDGWCGHPQGHRGV